MNYFKKKNKKKEEVEFQELKFMEESKQVRSKVRNGEYRAMFKYASNHSLWDNLGDFSALVEEYKREEGERKAEETESLRVAVDQDRALNKSLFQHSGNELLGIGDEEEEEEEKEYSQGEGGHMQHNMQQHNIEPNIEPNIEHNIEDSNIAISEQIPPLSSPTLPPRRSFLRSIRGIFGSRKNKVESNIVDRKEGKTLGQLKYINIFGKWFEVYSQQLQDISNNHKIFQQHFEQTLFKIAEDRELETNEPPLRTNEAPLKTNEPPLRTNEPPLKTNEAPLKTNEAAQPEAPLPERLRDELRMRINELRELEKEICECENNLDKLIEDLNNSMGAITERQISTNKRKSHLKWSTAGTVVTGACLAAICPYAVVGYYFFTIGSGISFLTAGTSGGIWYKHNNTSRNTNQLMHFIHKLILTLNEKTDLFASLKGFICEFRTQIEGVGAQYLGEGESNQVNQFNQVNQVNQLLRMSQFKTADIIGCSMNQIKELPNEMMDSFQII